MLKKILFLFCSSLLLSCSSTREKFLNPYAHVKNLSYWNQQRNGKNNLRDKFKKEIPGDLLNYMREDNKATGYSEIPAPFDLSKSEFGVIDRTLTALPTFLKKRLNPYIKGIFFVEHLGSSGYTEYIYDDQGLPLYAFMIFDRSILKMTANEWCSRKERTPFQLVDGFKLSCALEKGSQHHGAFLYILLHELGHVFQINNSFFPLPLSGQVNLSSIQDTDFFKLSWLIEENSALPQQPLSLGPTCDFRYYSPNPTCGPIDAFQLYEALGKSSFPTPYSTVAPWEDFAESFTNYISTQILKQSFEIELIQGDRKLLYTSCWDSPRCEAKARLMKTILGF